MFGIPFRAKKNSLPEREREREREKEKLTHLQQNKGVDMVVSDTDELSPRSVSAARSLGVRRAQWRRLDGPVTQIVGAVVCIGRVGITIG